MSKQNHKIKKGFLDIFYVFELYNSNGINVDNNKYKKILEKIYESGIVISAENQEKAVFFTDRFQNLINERKSEFRKNRSDKKKNPEYLNRSIKQLEDGPTVNLSATSGKIAISIYDEIEDELEYSQMRFMEKLINIYSSEEKYTGISTKEYKNRFLLFPPEISLIDDEYIFPGVYLTVFKNGYGIVQMSIDLTDFDFELINEVGWNLQLIDLSIPELLINGENSYDFKRVEEHYINNLLKIYADFVYKIINNHTPTIHGQYFYNLTLSKFPFNPDNFEKNGTPNYLALIYKLLYAPVEDYSLKSLEETSFFVNNRYYTYSKFSRMYANNNRIIQIFSKDFPTSISSLFEDPEVLTDEEFLNELCHNTALGGVINSIESILLKKEANQSLSVFKLQESTSLKRLLDLLIKDNVNYSMEFSKYFFTYASVREMMVFLEEKCEDFLQTKLMEERKIRIEKLISLKKEKNVTNITILGSVLTVFITLILSFPPIESILEYLNKTEYILLIYLVVNILYIFFLVYLFIEQIIQSIKMIRRKIKDVAIKIREVVVRFKIVIYKVKNIYMGIVTNSYIFLDRLKDDVYIKSKRKLNVCLKWIMKHFRG